MRIRIFTTNRFDREDLKLDYPQVIISVPVGEQSFFDVNFDDARLVANIAGWCLDGELAYEVYVV